MIPVVCLVQVLTLSATVFDVQSMPMAEPKPQIFYSQGDAHGNAAVCALAGSSLTVYFRSGEARTLALPDGVGAFDIASLEEGAAPQIVCRIGKQVFAIPLAATGQRIAPVTLFETENPEPGAAVQAFPRTMVISKDGRRGLVLPFEDAQEFRGLSGELLARYPNAAPENPSVEDMRVYSLAGKMAPLVPGGLAFIVGDDEMIGTGLPDEFTLAESASGHHEATFRREFPLSSTDSSLRVEYGYHAETWDTLITMPLVAPKANASKKNEPPAKKSPARRYPGTIMVDREYAPDFNGDGYTDLLLWSAPKPGLSIDSLIRTAIGNTWPIRLTIHLYSPDKKRFDPAPVTTIAMQVPVFWFVDLGRKRHPFPLWLVRDFDGDGKTDLLLPSKDSELSVWLARDGFGAAPSETMTFLEPLEQIIASSDVDLKGRTGLVIQGQSRLHILWPKE
ncbi:MAG: hypothetical protein WC655_23085 [Candidatus Hydrogenedentales bacterium]|jgi:hypothetical protein